MKASEAIAIAMDNWWDPKVLDKSSTQIVYMTGLPKNRINTLFLGNVFTDPDFWRCLGRGLHWKMFVCPECNTDATVGRQCNCYEFRETIWGWQYYWHKFVEHLAEDKTVDSFFEHFN